MYNKIVILTGAGISAESGISTFRDQNGLWEQHNIMDVASPEGFHSNPSLVYRFYNERRKAILNPEIQPNLAHLSLAEFEKSFEGEFLLITQNVDDLHERAGSKNLIHMHGELLKMRCQNSGNLFETHQSFDEKTSCSCCQMTGTLRPHIVWFGEMPLMMDEIQNWLNDCDLFLSIGTSGQVYPAAMFVEMAKVSAGAKTIEINLEATEKSHFFDDSFKGKATELVPKYLSEIS